MSDSAVYAYNTYEAVVNGIVGAIYLYVKNHRADKKHILMFGLEKALINVISSLVSVYTFTVQSDALDVEYLLSAVLAGLYHSGRAFDAAGDQLMVSIISHLISNMTTASGTDWFRRNVYGTTGSQKSGADLGG
jgi:hypothetical protein